MFAKVRLMLFLIDVLFSKTMSFNELLKGYYILSICLDKNDAKNLIDINFQHKKLTFVFISCQYNI